MHYRMKQLIIIRANASAAPGKYRKSVCVPAFEGMRITDEHH